MSSFKPHISSSFSFETQEEVLDIPHRSKSLLIGIPKEIAFQENRIGLIPDAVGVLVANGHEVMVESGAGAGSRYSDHDYAEAGARIVFEKEEVYKCPILVKNSAPRGSGFALFANASNYYFPFAFISIEKRIGGTINGKENHRTCY